MDTLAIVRKIRESETLAGQGRHADALRLLDELLAGAKLNNGQRELIERKHGLFTKQQERVTRRMHRLDGDESSRSSEITAVPRGEATERPTDKTGDEGPRGGTATEVVPKARNVDTDVPVSASWFARDRSPGPAPVGDAPDDEDGIPSIGRYGASGSLSAIREVTILDSMIVPGAAPPPGPGRREDDSYFGPPVAHHPSRSSPELRAMAEKLPVDDLRRELALEVLKLREELEEARAVRRPLKHADLGSDRLPDNRTETFDEAAEELAEGDEDDTRAVLARDYLNSRRFERPRRPSLWTGLTFGAALAVVAGYVIYRLVTGG